MEQENMAVKEETWSNKRLIDEGKQLSRIKYLIFWISAFLRGKN